jgi:tripartite motif-containing protein 71
LNCPASSPFEPNTRNHRIQVFDTDGKPIREWQAEFYGPRGIAIARDGTVYVTDTGNGRVLRFTPEGQQLQQFGKKGKGPGQLEEPMGIAVSERGDVYVADAGNERVVVFAADGTLRTSWPVPGWKEQAFREPGIALLPDGRVAVAVPAADRVLFFAADGKAAGEHAFAQNTGPIGLAVAPDGGLVVSEIKSNRLTRIPTR